MDYYQRKTRAMRLARSMIKDTSEEDICFCILERFGISEKFIKKYLESLRSRGFDKWTQNKNPERG